MKLMILMIIFTFTVLETTFTESTELEKNSIFIDHLSQDNLVKHTSRIQKRSILKLFGLKPRYRPVHISVNWKNQQRLTKNYNNREIINSRPSTLHIQKNFFFFNGLNVPNNQNYPAVHSSTTAKYSTTTDNVLENKSTTTMRIEDTFTKALMQPTESTFTTRYVTSTETTQINQITTSTTLRPQTDKPMNVMTTTEPTIINVSKNVNTESKKGGFTSTSMPQNNEYSELIYDIDPRYK